jgi:hypothetical protein
MAEFHPSLIFMMADYSYWRNWSHSRSAHPNDGVILSLRRIWRGARMYLAAVAVRARSFTGSRPFRTTPFIRTGHCRTGHDRILIGSAQAGNAVQAAFRRDDSITVEINFMPETPSSTVGTSRDDGSGGRASMCALICSAMSA